MAVPERGVLVDFHVHSVLSPCADLRMGTKSIANRAAEEGIEVLVVSDHNATANCPAFSKVLGGAGIRFFPGMEVQSREDVHVLCVFGTIEAALAFQELVWRALPPARNDPDLLGYQVLIDEDDDVLGFEERLLLAGVDLGADEIALLAHDEFDALVIMAHVDRPSLSYTAVFGFVPPGLPCALEVSCRCDLDLYERLRALHPTYPFVSSSDAHRVEDIRRSCATLVWLEELSFEALKGSVLGGRCCPYRFLEHQQVGGGSP